ncbi:MAG: 4,5-DOPA dioxygenase extradiol [Bacteroidia bacterium]|nr:4,5-DOPA dioxygenase extradiol [Bacteroidia bacterium]
MDRKNFLKSLAMIPLSTQVMKLSALEQLTSSFASTDLMPVLFVGHGSPMNAIEDNVFSREMKAIGKKLPKPKAILMVSAHWETKGTFVTAVEKPETIHDFGGFPRELFEVQYPAPGSKWLAEETQKTISTTTVGLDYRWGLDHGCWSVTRNLFPAADVPIIQLSLDYTREAQYHYDLAKQLYALRKKGVLIIGSGNMVHNFGYVAMAPGYEGDFNHPFGHAWALEANATFKKLIDTDDHKSLINYKTYSNALKLAAPTPEHYLPLLYTLALKDKADRVSYFNDAAVAGSFTMTSVILSGKLV